MMMASPPCSAGISSPPFTAVTLTVPLAPQFVHLDATLVMLADKYALVCEDALEPYVLDFLR